MSQPPINKNFHFVWNPLDGSQRDAYDVPVDDILYHGARGPGKTDAQLMRFRRRVGIGYGAFWRGIIFDREYKNLDDLIAKSRRWFPQYQDGARWLSSKSDYKWVWPTGEELMFRAIKTQDDYWNFHGQEFPYIGWNELCKFPTLELYDKLMSCNRSSFTPEKDTPEGRWVDTDGRLMCDKSDGVMMPRIPLETFATTNPSGPGHNAVKNRFINPAPNGDIIMHVSRVFDPKTKQEVEVTRTQVAIFGTWRENPYLDTKYIASLNAITDPNLRKAWTGGSWDVTAGGALDDVWDRSIHILPRFAVPSGWHVDRALDWGSSHPYSVTFWAEANGEEVTLEDGRTFCPPAGTLIQIAELYGAEGGVIGINRGAKLSARSLAQRIEEYEELLVLNGWISSRPYPGPADNQIRNVNEAETETIAALMALQGIVWTESDKSQGSRRIGLQLMRDRLENAVKGEGPGLYFMRNCRASIQTIPILPRDDDKIDDVDTTAEDHAYDSVRYRVLKSTNRIAVNPNFGFAVGGC